MTSTKPNNRWAPLLLAIGLAMSAMGLHAQSLTPRTCEAWNTARKANLSSAVQREWLFGYLNGWRDAQLASQGPDVFQTMPAVEVLIEKANVFCEANPQALVAQTIAAILQTVTDK